jgi:hypothetical protein
MNLRKAGSIASIGSLLGLGIGVCALFLPSQIERLCASDTTCVASLDRLHWGIPGSTWIAAFFIGLTWASLSLTLGRKGYTQSGKSLLIMGLGTLIVLSTVLEATSTLPGQISLAGAGLVSIGGFLARQKNDDPDRAIGAVCVGLAVVLLISGSKVQYNALTKPWTDLTTAPALTGKEAVLDGSAKDFKHKVLFWADFSTPAASDAYSQLKQFNKENGNTLRVLFKPLALNDGMPIAMGFHCAKKNGRSQNFVDKVLNTTGDLTSSNTINALALRSGFKQDEFTTCIEDAGARKRLAADTNAALKNGALMPFSILVESTDGWKRLSANAGISSQLRSILGYKPEGS